MTEKWNIFRNPRLGFLQNLLMQIKLIFRLMGDKRVSIFLKLLPIGALIYLVSPVDLIPGALFPIVGGLDDAAVLWLGATLFVNLCPDEIVKEHLQALQLGLTGTWQETPEQDENDEVIEVDAHEVTNDNQ